MLEAVAHVLNVGDSVGANIRPILADHINWGFFIVTSVIIRTAKCFEVLDVVSNDVFSELADGLLGWETVGVTD